MPISPFTAAINQLSDERGLPRDIVHETINSAVAAAYRKEYGMPDQVIRADFDEESGHFKVWQVFEVIEEPTEEEQPLNPEYQTLLEDAKKIKKGIEVGETYETELKPHSNFGRIAAQTAKQVIIQKLREAERNILLEEYKEKMGTLINAYVQQVEGPNVILNIGKLNGLMIASDQIPGQYYHTGQRVKVLVYSVEDTPKGPRVMVTRSSADFIAKLFELEVPEISAGNVEIKTAVREAGSRTKIAVIATAPGLDPVGSCVGQRGTRVNAVLSEIGGERIDIVEFNEDTEAYIRTALAPAKIDTIRLNKKSNIADITVPDDQLSLAIGKNGQNVRLASKLTGWEINIDKGDNKPEVKKVTPEVAENEAEVEPAAEVAEPAPKKPKAKKAKSED